MSEPFAQYDGQLTAPPPEVLDAVLRIESQTFVQKVDWFSEIGSTNDHALSLAAQPTLETPRLIWADRQHAGRGRSGNAWWSAGGALTCSLVIERESWAPRWSLVSLVTGLAIADALAELLPGLQVQVKWPNDVFLEGRKVCGILIEPVPASPERLVIGFGINVANSFATAPPELRATATAVCDHRPAAALPAEVLLNVLQHWERARERFCANPAGIVNDWSQRCLLTAREVQLSAGTASVRGTCRGIDEEGQLLIETARGYERRIAGTVRIIPVA